VFNLTKTVSPVKLNACRFFCGNLIIYHWYIVGKLSISLPLANKAFIIEQNL